MPSSGVANRKTVWTVIQASTSGLTPAKTSVPPAGCHHSATREDERGRDEQDAAQDERHRVACRRRS